MPDDGKLIGASWSSNTYFEQRCFTLGSVKSLRVRRIWMYALVRSYFNTRRAQKKSKDMSFGVPGLSLHIIFEKASCLVGQHWEIY